MSHKTKNNALSLCPILDKEKDYMCRVQSRWEGVGRGGEGRRGEGRGGEGRGGEGRGGENRRDFSCMAQMRSIDVILVLTTLVNAMNFVTYCIACLITSLFTLPVHSVRCHIPRVAQTLHKGHVYWYWYVYLIRFILAFRSLLLVFDSGHDKALKLPMIAVWMGSMMEIVRLLRV